MTTVEMLTQNGMSHKALQIGDAFTFIYAEAVMNDDTKAPVRIGDILSKWFSTDEPGRLFEIVHFHAPATYETRFIGFQRVEVRP